MPKRKDIQKVLVIGSGPIVIGQAAEFDYAGTQACRVLKEEGLTVVLVNSNPATIMTDPEIADRVYLEPLTMESVAKIIEMERPDSLLATLGGQTGLNLAVELAEAGVLEQYGVTLLGTSVESIQKSEDRELFKETMEGIGEPVIDSTVVHNLPDAMAYARQVGYPLIVRPAYTLGGTGGGFAFDAEGLTEIATHGMRASRTGQVLIEKSVFGWKEIEYEVMRDHNGNCITICNMENFDPVGIHTGDSIVVAPSQTLRDQEHQMLRSAAINIIEALAIEGGCNVQFALEPDGERYYVIEVNPRLSRSSALASKATGYPIAKVATRIAIGYTLDEIVNGVTGKTMACFEPTLDYMVVKFPRWPFDKFPYADSRIGTQMKATGEVMAIGSNFPAALLKAVRSLELGQFSLEMPSLRLYSDVELLEMTKAADHQRLFVIAELFRRGVEMEAIFETTMIDRWFLGHVKDIVAMEEEAKHLPLNRFDRDTMLRMKKYGLSDAALSDWHDVEEEAVREMRKGMGILPAYRMVDTCGAEFAAVSPYYYSCYDAENEFVKNGRECALVLGSGPIRIGQGIEFDYCSVHCVFSLKRMGYETVIINNNPETVSTDFDISDRLYFEPLAKEDVLNILEMENPMGVVAQFGGQTAIKLAQMVEENGYPILGTPFDAIDTAEDRERFDAMMAELSIARPKGDTVFTAEEAVAAANHLGYPVLVRPSYVLGGQGMEIAYEDRDIREFMAVISITKQEHPILIDKYLKGIEMEVDAICDGEEVLIPGLMEHIEKAGIHSGDSISVYPTLDVSAELEAHIVDVTRRIANRLKVKGLMNIQFIYMDGELYVIEVNPRSSRTVPYISKVTGIPMVDLGVRAGFGEKVADMGFGTGLYEKADAYAVKNPVFSTEKLPDVGVSLGPEMKSTGEVLGLARTFDEALLKSMLAAQTKVPTSGGILITVKDSDKAEAAEIAKAYEELGFTIYSTSGTAKALLANGVDVQMVDESAGRLETLLNEIAMGTFSLVINTPTNGRMPHSDGFMIRRRAVEAGIPCLTSLDTARAMLGSIRLLQQGKGITPLGLHDVHVNRRNA
ncbi:carbamoyl-phosphate synthase large subunit [Eubacteriales bacterium OttesenSCG-928-M02]|nr:carbamoyl-phosphate synthase large subunit [Eubacteriales bacterium OttesenSCG-928-M02]